MLRQSRKQIVEHDSVDHLLNQHWDNGDLGLWKEVSDLCMPHIRTLELGACPVTMAHPDLSLIHI